MQAYWVLGSISRTNAFAFKEFADKVYVNQIKLISDFNDITSGGKPLSPKDRVMAAKNLLLMTLAVAKFDYNNRQSTTNRDSQDYSYNTFVENIQDISRVCMMAI
jgi:hypothetical protein